MLKCAWMAVHVALLLLKDYKKVEAEYKKKNIVVY